MIIYKVPTRQYPETGDEHTGYVWTFSKREANQIFKENNADPRRGDEIQSYELVMNKHDVIRFLNAYCSHPDNG